MKTFELQFKEEMAFGKKTKEWTPHLYQRHDGSFQFFLYNDLLQRIKIDTIIDVGSYKGVTLREFREAYKDVKLYGFEPSSENFKLLKTNLKDFPEINLFNVAVSDCSGISKLYLHPEASCHSILPHTRGKTETEENVSVIRLDEWALENNVEHFDLVKIDTQGNDFRVILGMGDLIKTVKILRTEVWFSEDGYEDSHLFHELMIYLYSQGLLLYNFEILAHDNKACLRWGDAIFLRRDILSQIKKYEI